MLFTNSCGSQLPTSKISVRLI